MECYKALVLCGLLTIAASSCKNGWIRHDSTCYHFSHDKEDWIGALGMCKLLGGTLLEINDAAENNFIAGQAVTRNSFEPFMALSDVVEEGVWKWMVSNVVLTNTSYTNWDDNEPNNSHGIENCVFMRQNGKWNDDECYHDHFYICEATDEGSVEIVG